MGVRNARPEVRPDSSGMAGESSAVIQTAAAWTDESRDLITYQAQPIQPKLVFRGEIVSTMSPYPLSSLAEFNSIFPRLKFFNRGLSNTVCYYETVSGLSGLNLF